MFVVGERQKREDAVLPYSYELRGVGFDGRAGRSDEGDMRRYKKSVELPAAFLPLYHRHQIFDLDWFDRHEALAVLAASLKAK